MSLGTCGMAEDEGCELLLSLAKQVETAEDLRVDVVKDGANVAAVADIEHQHAAR